MEKLACDGCEFWSELIAKSVPTHKGMAVVAMCLNTVAPSYSEYTYRGCPQRSPGEPIDMVAK